MFLIPNPPPSPYHPSGSSQCTSPKHPALCIEPGLATRFIHDILHVSYCLILTYSLELTLVILINNYSNQIKNIPELGVSYIFCKSRGREFPCPHRQPQVHPSAPLTAFPPRQCRSLDRHPVTGILPACCGFTCHNKPSKQFSEKPFTALLLSLKNKCYFI